MDNNPTPTQDIPQPPVIPDVPTLDTPPPPEPTSPTPSTDTPAESSNPEVTTESHDAPEPEAKPETPPAIPPSETAPQTPSAQTDSQAASSTPPPPQTPKHLSFPTVVLIILLAILAGVLLFFALNPIKKPAVALRPPKANVPVQSMAHTTLSLIATTSASPITGKTTKSVLVSIDTSSNTVTGVQFEISYDPQVLSNVVVTPGSFFTSPLVSLNQVDAADGNVNFAIGVQPSAKGATGSGTIAVISYTILPTATASATDLTFLPKTQVTQSGTVSSVLEKANNLSLPTGIVSKILPPTASPLTSTPAAK